MAGKAGIPILVFKICALKHPLLDLSDHCYCPKAEHLGALDGEEQLSLIFSLSFLKFN